MESKSLRWMVFYYNFNSKQIEEFNIFNHGRFREEVKELMDDSALTYAEFKDGIRRELMYYFWSKCEWEVIISGWPDKGGAEKIDVFRQVMLNFDRFIEYLYGEIERKADG